jgi:hypothetical protein
MALAQDVFVFLFLKGLHSSDVQLWLSVGFGGFLEEGFFWCQATENPSKAVADSISILICSQKLKMKSGATGM